LKYANIYISDHIPLLDVSFLLAERSDVEIQAV